MFYSKLTNGKLVKWWMGKWYNGEIKNRTGYLFSHKYRICSFVLFLNTAFLQQTKQYITFNFLSLKTSTATKFILSNQATTEIRDFIRGRPIVVRQIVWLYQSQVIQNFNQPVLAISLELNMTYSVLRLLISFREYPWYSLFYYMRAICTYQQGQCATYIWFKTYSVPLSYQYMS